MKRIWKYLFLLLSISSNAQNFVPNPSFEDTVACPINGRVYNCKIWVESGGTPDYNNVCVGSSKPFGIPFNTIGYQWPATGNAYCQIWTYSTVGLYREFIGVPLTTPMIVGHTYQVSFKCSPGTFMQYTMQANKLGIRFSTMTYDSVNWAPIDNFAHVYSDSIVRDTTNWTTITGIITADSAYTFLAVGNFFDDAHTDTAYLNPLSGFTVYFIDDVEVFDTEVGLNEEPKSDNQIQVKYLDQVILITSSISIEGFELYNSLGQIIISEFEPKNNKIYLPRNGLNTGIYFVRIQTNRSFRVIKLLIY